MQRIASGTAIVPWYTSPEFRRHAGPDLFLAALCLLLAFPPLSATDYATGLAAAVSVQVLFCFLDIPVLYVLAVLSHLRAPKWLLGFGLITVYAFAGGWLYAATRVEGRSDAAVLSVFLLPLALRAWNLLRGLRDVERVQTWVLFSICQILPWMLSLMLVLWPLTEWFGFGRPIPNSHSTEALPPAWLAMGTMYFALIGLGRYVLVHIMQQRVAST